MKRILLSSSFVFFLNCSIKREQGRIYHEKRSDFFLTLKILLALYFLNTTITTHVCFLLCLLYHLTNNVKISKLSFGSFRVDLTHVASSVTLLHVLNVKIPRAMLVMCDFDPGITCDYMSLHCEDCRTLEMDPCHLKHIQKYIHL